MAKKIYSPEINLIDLYLKILRHKILFISVILIFILASFSNYLIKNQKKYEYNWRINEINISDQEVLNLESVNNKFKKNISSKNLSNSFTNKFFQIDLSSIISEIIITNEMLSISNDFQIEKTFDFSLITYDQNLKIEEYFFEFLKFCRLKILDEMINDIENNLEKLRFQIADKKNDLPEYLIKKTIDSNLQSIEYINELKLKNNFTLIKKKSLINQNDKLIFNLILGLFFGLLFSTILIHFKKK